MKKLWILGDSTSVDYRENEENGLQSWAHFFKELLNDNIECKNVAVGGTTLKWFFLSPKYQSGETNINNPNDSRWTNIVSQVQNGDYFIIFTGGINDQGQHRFDAYYPDENGDYIKVVSDTDKDVFVKAEKGKGTHRFFTARSTTDEFADILTQMIEQIKLKGAFPLLIRGTANYFCRNNNDMDVFPDSREYINRLPEVAKKTSVYYLDAGSIFEEDFKLLGYKEMLKRNFAKNDICHHNKNGAKKICDIITNLIKESDFSLKNYLKS